MPSAKVTLRGHIIDSMILPAVLDTIMDLGGNFSIDELLVGQEKGDSSTCRITLGADDDAQLDRLVHAVQQHGAQLDSDQDATLVACARSGVYPEDFYATSNLPTQVLVDGEWLDVENIEMDCGIAGDRASRRARCVTFGRLQAGMEVVVGHHGVRVQPLERSRRTEIFSFMTSQVSAEKPKKLLTSEIARQMREVRSEGGRILFVGGPAIVHVGAAVHLSRLIELGFVDVLFAGNALALHDIEAALMGTSLGINLESGISIEQGHEHHLRTVNRIRAAGSIREAIASGLIQRGIMHAAYSRGIEVVLAGSIRDDGPLPEVITDAMEAQERMRDAVPGVRLALLVASMLHSIATGNMLPATVRTVCVDINPAVVTKLADRGSFQAIGLVTDVESFLRELVADLEN
ncbi:MAG: ornithine cyclodeaminase, nickel-pincer nucleotide-dependent [Candidatus Dormibacteria bacterium]